MNELTVSSKEYYADGKVAGVVYSFGYRSMLSGHEVTLYRDNDGVWSGDIIEYGEWRDLDEEEIEDYKKLIATHIKE